MARFTQAVRNYGPLIQPLPSLTQKALHGRLTPQGYEAPWDAVIPDDPLDLPRLMEDQAA